MEGERAWSFAAPAFAHTVAPAEPLAGATYLPAGLKKRRRRGKKQQGRKRHKAGGSGAREAAALLPAALPALGCLAPVPPPDPTQLAPLRCSVAHPAVLSLLTQQCWPAAGPAAMVPCSMSAAPGCGLPTSWWNRMLPSLSLLHPPLSAQQQAAALAAGTSIGDAGPLRAMQLPQPNVLVGFEVRTHENMAWLRTLAPERLRRQLLRDKPAWPGCQRFASPPCLPCRMTG